MPSTPRSTSESSSLHNCWGHGPRTAREQSSAAFGVNFNRLFEVLSPAPPLALYEVLSPAPPLAFFDGLSPAPPLEVLSRLAQLRLNALFPRKLRGFEYVVRCRVAMADLSSF